MIWRIVRVLSILKSDSNPDVSKGYHSITLLRVLSKILKGFGERPASLFARLMLLFE